MLLIKGGESIPKPEIIPTPSFGLNYILGGGLWTGRYHILWGNPQAGKTTLALHTAAEAQKLGYVPVIVDSEGSLTDEWAEHCGIDNNNRMVIRSTRLEDIMEVILPLARDKSANYCFIIDSINSIVMESFYKNDDGTGAIGIYARSQAVLFQKLSDIVIESVSHIFLLIAQQTITSKGQFMVTDGKFGNAARHWATNIIRLSAGDAKSDMDQDDDERILTRKVTWKIQKSKQSPIQGTKGDYWFSPDTADINKKKEAVHLAVRNGVIEKKGAWFYYDGEKYQGQPALEDALTEENLQDIVNQLQQVEDWDFDVDEGTTI